MPSAVRQPGRVVVVSRKRVTRAWPTQLGMAWGSHEAESGRSVGFLPFVTGCNSPRPRTSTPVSRRASGAPDPEKRAEDSAMGGGARSGLEWVSVEAGRYPVPIEAIGETLLDWYGPTIPIPVTADLAVPMGGAAGGSVPKSKSRGDDPAKQPRSSPAKWAKLTWDDLEALGRSGKPSRGWSYQPKRTGQRLEDHD